jgi:hypothetical protein
MSGRIGLGAESSAAVDAGHALLPPRCSSIVVKPPQPWERYVALLDEVEEPYFTAVCNTMRLAHGLPVCGHGMTYDFMVCNESARRARGF